MRVSYVKVAEFQRRGALHFHCVLRLDGSTRTARSSAPAPRVRASELLIDAATAAARHVSVLSPVPRRTRRCRQRDPLGRAGRGARARRARSSKRRRRGYIAKYATKSTEAVGGLLYRLEADDIERLRVRPHVRRYVECAWHLGAAPRAAPAEAAAVGALARVPRALLHEEPPLLDDVHGAAPGAPRARSCGAPASSGRASCDVRPLALQRLGLPDARRCVARRVGPQACASSSGASRAKSFAPAIAIEGRRR